MKIKTPADIANSVSNIGIKKAELPADKMLLLGFLAGAFIAFGGLLAIMVSAGMPADVWGSLTKLVFAGVFPVGLMLVIIAGAELATGNMMTQPLSLFTGKINLNGLLKNWLLVYLGNIIGSLFVAYFLAYLTGITTAEPWSSFIINVANSKVSLSWSEAFWRGVGANWLVGLAVWMSLSTSDLSGKLLAIWWPIMTFVAIGFEHSIANTFFVPLAIFTGSAAGYSGTVLNASWSSFFFNNLIPVTLGNILGAGIFVSLIYWYLFLRADQEKAFDIKLVGTEKGLNSEAGR